MRIRNVVFALLLSTWCTSFAAAECKSSVNGQITEVRNTWITDWKAKNLDNLVSLYAPDAVFLQADGSRATGRDEIRAALQKQLGAPLSVQSVTVDCSGEFAYDDGTFTEDIPGGVTITSGVTMTQGTSINAGTKHIQGNYLVVLKRENGKWLIVQHASTAKP